MPPHLPHPVPAGSSLTKVTAAHDVTPALFQSKDCGHPCPPESKRQLSPAIAPCRERNSIWGTEQGMLWYILRLHIPFAAPKGQVWKVGPSLRVTGISRKPHEQHQLHPRQLPWDAEELVQLVLVASKRGCTQGLPRCCTPRGLEAMSPGAGRG